MRVIYLSLRHPETIGKTVLSILITIMPYHCSWLDAKCLVYPPAWDEDLPSWLSHCNLTKIIYIFALGWFVPQTFCPREDYDTFSRWRHFGPRNVSPHCKFASRYIYRYLKIGRCKKHEQFIFRQILKFRFENVISEDIDYCRCSSVSILY